MGFLGERSSELRKQVTSLSFAGSVGIRAACPVLGQRVDTAMLLNYELRVYYQLMHAHVARNLPTKVGLDRKQRKHTRTTR